MDQYQQLKQVIQKANPEIMELKFGCRVSHCDEPATVIDVLENHPFMFSASILRGNKAETVFDISKEELEIYGRPIRLADVLWGLRLNAEPKDYFKLLGLVQNGNGLFFTQALWNWKDDNLDNQSDECKEFLINLLVHE